MPSPVNNGSVDTALQVQGAKVHFRGSESAAYEGLSLELKQAEWTCLLGPSGCGKSTLLRQIAGLIDPEHSSEMQYYSVYGEDLSQQVAWMGQQDLLYPWLTVIENVCLKQRLQHGRVDHTTRQRGLEILEMLGLLSWQDQRPEALSGGMRQRVALARTLMQDKPLVLMDEPFSALDAVNRHKLQALAVQLLTTKTVLLVTHDPQEALRLGQQILLFRDEPKSLAVLNCPAGQPPRQLAALGAYQEQLLSDLGVSACAC